MRQCLNDLFSYCTGEPIEQTSEGYILVFDFKGRKHKVRAPWMRCRLNRTFCGHYLTQTQLHLHIQASDRALTSTKE